MLRKLIVISVPSPSSVQWKIKCFKATDSNVKCRSVRYHGQYSVKNDPTQALALISDLWPKYIMMKPIIVFNELIKKDTLQCRWYVRALRFKMLSANREVLGTGT